MQKDLNFSIQLQNMFDSFMIEVISYRDRILKEDPTATYDIIHRNLSSIIKEILDTPKGASFDKKNKDAVYIMVSIADELFLNLDWIGKQYWEEHMLERRFFGSQIAGEKIFQDIDILLSNHQIHDTDFAELYIKALAFGFKGKYREVSENEINSYRKQLFHIVAKYDSSVKIIENRLFQRSYDRTLSTVHRQFLPDVSVVNYVCAFFIFMFLVISSIAWIVETRPLSETLRTISGMVMRS